MIEYYDGLPQEEQQELTAVIQKLLNQNFILERRYEKRTQRFVLNREYHVLSMHLTFLKEYFAVCGIEIEENVQSGVIFLHSEGIESRHLSKLATIYLLILKLIYDEQMEQASGSIQIYTTLGDINERMGSFRLLKERPSPTEIKRTLTFLKRRQMIEVPDTLEDLTADTRIIIYPCINMVLFGENVRALLRSFTDEASKEEENFEVELRQEEEADDGAGDESGDGTEEESVDGAGGESGDGAEE